MKTKREVMWLTETTAKVIVGARVESVYRGVRTGRWVATFNGITREFETENEAINYATGNESSLLA